MTLAALVLWGVVVGLDATSVAQTMLSRPLVACAVAGAILGHPVEGATLGVVLEIFALLVLPIGAVRYPESGVAGVASTYALVQGGEPELTAVPLLLAAVFALGWERVAGGSVTLLRRCNERLMADAPSRGAVDAGRLERLHLAAIACDAVRAGLVTLVGALAGRWLVSGLAGYWGLGDEAAFRALAIALAMAIGATLSLFGMERKRLVLLLIGVSCGLAILSFR